MSGDDGLSPGETFHLPEEGELDPRPMVRRLVDECEEFAPLRIGEAVIMVVMRAEEVIKAGKRILGTMALPRWQGSMGPLALWLLAKACGGTLPDFILTIEADWWKDATPIQREALVHHELCHAQHATGRDGGLRFTDAGLPIWAIVDHDISEFFLTVQRYGDWKGEVAELIAALGGHGRK